MHRRQTIFTALIITAFVTLPRLLVWEVNVIDLVCRSIYVFSLCLVLITINLHKRRVLCSLLLVLIIDVALLRLHLQFYDPAAGKRLYKALFHANLFVAAIMSVLLCEIFRLWLRNAEARYEILKSQVNPHFLFNSFNTINNLIVTDQQAAVEFVNNMSDVFRYVLKSGYVQSITVEEELQFLASYTHMLNGRYGNKLQIEIDVPASLQNYHLPPMALQILMENAVKHNIVSQAKPLRVQISSHRHTLVVSNNLQLKKTIEPSTKLGLSNLNQRCKFLSKCPLLIQQTPNEFAVTIPLVL